MLFSDFFFFSSRRRHTRSLCDWSSDVCSSDLDAGSREPVEADGLRGHRNTEVRDQRLEPGNAVTRVTRKENVFRLDVAVDQTAVVGVVERARDGPRDVERIPDRELLLPVESRA